MCLVLVVATHSQIKGSNLVVVNSLVLHSSLNEELLNIEAQVVVNLVTFIKFVLGILALD